MISRSSPVLSEFAIRGNSVSAIGVTLILLFINPLWALIAFALVGVQVRKKWTELVIALSLTMFMCNREFGGSEDDMPMYVYLFEAAKNHNLTYLFNNWTFEPGYILFSKVLATIADGRKGFVFILYFLVNGFLVHAAAKLNRKSCCLVLALYFLSTGAVYFDHIRAMRQTLALVLILNGAAELFTTDKLSAKGAAYLILAPLLHVSAVPAAAGLLASRLLWPKSSWIRYMGIFVVSIGAYLLASYVLVVFYGLSSRVEIYKQNTGEELSIAQLVGGMLMATWLIVRSVPSKAVSGSGPVMYCTGLIVVALVALSLTGDLPGRVLSRELIFSLGLILVVGFSTVASSRLFRLAKLPLIAFAVLRLTAIYISPPEGMRIVMAHGAMNPLSGVFVNTLSYISDVKIPAYFATGGL